jgi:hypothetical protein
MSRRDMCTGTRSSYSERRGMWSLGQLWHISTMVSIILKLHVHLGVDDLLDVRCIDHIGGSMLEHVKHLCLEEYAEAWRGMVIQDSKK